MRNIINSEGLEHGTAGVMGHYTLATCSSGWICILSTVNHGKVTVINEDKEESLKLALEAAANLTFDHIVSNLLPETKADMGRWNAGQCNVCGEDKQNPDFSRCFHCLER